MDSFALYKEPRNKILKRIEKVEKEPEMTEFESGFLCGLIKKEQPVKIVEVGVAAGGTTAIILQCLNDLNIKRYKMYSVDYSEKFYRDNTKMTGFLGEQAKKLLGGAESHEFLLGDILPNLIEHIMQDGIAIDFVILDTMHVLPGEILDFLAILPYLNNTATIVLHDIAMNHWDSRAISTKVLFDTVVADKIIMEDDSKRAKMANIGAFHITDDTKKYLYNVFSSLTLSWEYLPTKAEVKAYEDLYKKKYSPELVHLFKQAYELNMYDIKNIKARKLPMIQRIRKIGKLIIKGHL